MMDEWLKVEKISQTRSVFPKGPPNKSMSRQEKPRMLGIDESL